MPRKSAGSLWAPGTAVVERGLGGAVISGVVEVEVGEPEAEVVEADTLGPEAEVVEADTLGPEAEAGGEEAGEPETEAGLCAGGRDTVTSV
jgi:hypothetical protein